MSEDSHSHSSSPEPKGTLSAAAACCCASGHKTSGSGSGGAGGGRVPLLSNAPSPWSPHQSLASPVVRAQPTAGTHISGGDPLAAFLASVEQALAKTDVDQPGFKTGVPPSPHLENIRRQREVLLGVWSEFYRSR